MKQTATIIITADSETGEVEATMSLDPRVEFDAPGIDINDYPAAVIAASVMQLIAAIGDASTEED